MCGIAGVMGTNISKKLYDMLISLKHRGPDGSGAFVDGDVYYGDLNDLEIHEGSFGLGHNLLSIVGCEGSQPLIYDNYVLVCNGEIYNFKELKNKFNINFKTDSDCEIIIRLIKRFDDGSLYDAVIKTIEQLDGDYAFAVYDGKNFAAVRDPVGVKPLYFGENNTQKTFAFASEKKALWKIDITNVKTLSPDSMLYNKKLVKLNSNLKENIDIVCSLQNQSYLSKDILKKQLKEFLITSVKKRISGLSEVGILFSGGIDSTIIAKITDDLGIKTCLYSVGHENSADLKFARETAEKMNLPLKTKVVDVEDVRKYLLPVLDAIEEFNIMKIGVGMPAYVAAEMAHEDNFKVMLSGQGADELFGGYNRYLKFYAEKGERAQEELRKDILNLYHVNLQRDDAVTMAKSVELRVPYLDPDIINIAMNIPMKYKINKDDTLRKCILREVGAELGVPEEIVKRPKKAAQYGSGIHKMLVKKVLKEESFKNIQNRFDQYVI